MRASKRPRRPPPHLVRHPFSGRPSAARRRRLLAEAALLPKAPGVYRFFGYKDRLIYLGKAASLQDRVSSYFHQKRRYPPRLRRILAEVQRLEYTPTGSEFECLLLERRLIAEERPLLNWEHQRFEAYPYLAITDEPFPRLVAARQRPDYNRVVGPFTSPRPVFDGVEPLRHWFLLRSCDGRLPSQSCLYLDLDQCRGPCIQRETAAEYGKRVAALWGCLMTAELPCTQLEAAMHQAAVELQFEQAETLKHHWAALLALQHQLQRLARWRDQRAVVVQPSLEAGHQRVFCINQGLVCRCWDMPAATPIRELQGTLQQAFESPVSPTLNAEEVDELKVVDRWLRRHNEADCCFMLPKDFTHWKRLAVQILQLPNG